MWWVYAALAGGHTTAKIGSDECTAGTHIAHAPLETVKLRQGGFQDILGPSS